MCRTAALESIMQIKDPHFLSDDPILNNNQRLRREEGEVWVSRHAVSVSHAVVRTDPGHQIGTTLSDLIAFSSGDPGLLYLLYL